MDGQNIVPQKSVVLIGTSTWFLGTVVAAIGGVSAIGFMNKKKKPTTIEEEIIDPTTRVTTPWLKVSNQDLNLIKNMFSYLTEMNRLIFFSLLYNCGFYRMSDTMFSIMASNNLSGQVMYTTDIITNEKNNYMTTIQRSDEPTFVWEDGLIFSTLLTRIFNKYGRKKDLLNYLKEITNNTLKMYSNFTIQIKQDDLYVSILPEQLTTYILTMDKQFVRVGNDNLLERQQNKYTLCLDQLGRIFDINLKAYWCVVGTKFYTTEDFTQNDILYLRTFQNFGTVCCNDQETIFLNFAHLTFMPTFTKDAIGPNTVTRSIRDSVLVHLGLKQPKNTFSVPYPILHVITKNLKTYDYSSYLYRYIPSYVVLLGDSLIKAIPGGITSAPSLNATNNLEQYGHSSTPYFGLSSHDETLSQKEITDTICLFFTPTCCCLVLNNPTIQEISINKNVMTQQFFEHIKKDKYGFILIKNPPCPIQVLYQLLKVYEKTNPNNRVPNFFPLNLKTEIWCVSYRTQFRMETYTGNMPVLANNESSFIVNIENIHTQFFSTIYLSKFGSKPYITDKNFKKLTKMEIEEYIRKI